jgi:hypothetical protein
VPTVQEVETQRQRLLQALAALPTQGLGLDKPQQRAIDNDDPSEWDDLTWEYANARGVLDARGLKGDYMVRKLEQKQREERAQLMAWQGGNNPHTGTVGAGAVGLSEFPDQSSLEPVSASEHSARRQAAIRESAGPDDRGEEPDLSELPYAEWPKAELETEIDNRNRERVANDQPPLSKSGNKQALAERLDQDDREQETEPTE